jgi:4-amino-4-deoxy-L-arabinose transferase-like glycosyltransferase
MRKRDLVLLYFVALIMLSITIFFQSDPGYMDSEFYYLGGRQIIQGSLEIPVIWNYLDNPTSLPNPIFSYWMPFPSIVSALSMFIFGPSFLGSRIINLILAAGLAPLTYWFSFKITANRFTSIMAGSMAILSGYYLKFLTIPETILPYMFLGILYFYIFSRFTSRDYEKDVNSKDFLFLGLITGLLHLTRADGLIFFIMGLALIVYLLVKRKKNGTKKWLLNIVIFIGSYCLVMSFWFVSNLHFYDSIFAPATSKAIWIATYDDTFIYPSSRLNLSYWFENAIQLRPSQVFEAIKLNLGTFIGVQLMIFGLPLFILGVKRNIKNHMLRIGILFYIMIFFSMTIIFPLAGARGGFLHSASAVQILIWILVADGLQSFFDWGIRKRNWNLIRSQRMFGTAFIAIIALFTLVVYKNDVVGDSTRELKWEQDYNQYEKIEEIIAQKTLDKTDVIMINNPLGYYYSTGRWSIVVPNAEMDQLLEVMQLFNVKYLVLDENLPEKFNDSHGNLINAYFKIIQETQSGIKIYEYK